MKKFFFFSFFFSLSLLAAPEQPSVRQGRVTFEGNKVYCEDHVWIDWNAFSLSEKESIEFIQPTKNSLALNRVTGLSKSLLMGKLKATGNFYLLNPQGIIVGKNSVIDTAGFLASTLQINPPDLLSAFKNKEEAFFQGKEGTIEINGSLLASEGDIFLIAKDIDITSSIKAPLGGIYMAVGEDVYLSFSSKDKLNVKTSLEDFKKTVTVSGSLEANTLFIQGEGSLFSLAIQETGCLNASKIEKNNGRITLLAEKGSLSVNGSLEAKEEGSISLFAKDIFLEEKSHLNASGDISGTILIGGDFQGKKIDAPFIAENVAIKKGSFIEASGALSLGGKIIAFSEKAMVFEGEIEAKGTDGGFVEVSGKEYLSFKGKVSTLPLDPFLGKTGMLLLDPSNVTLSLNPTTNMQNNGANFVPNGTLTGCNIDITELQTNLNTTSVTVFTISIAGEAGNITVSDALSWTSGRSLSLTAEGSIFINSPITWSNGAFLTLNASSNITINNSLTADSISSLNLIGQNVFIGSSLHSNPISISASQFYCTASGSFNVQGGIASNADVQITSPNFSINCASFSCTGGSDVNCGVSLLSSNSFNNFTINTPGNISLQGGSGLNSSVTINSLGAISLTSSVGSCTLTGGSGDNASININAADFIGISSQGNLSLIAGSGGSSSIFLTSGSNLNLSSQDNMFLTGVNGLNSSVSISPSSGASLYAANSLICQAGPANGAHITLNGGSLSSADLILLVSNLIELRGSLVGGTPSASLGGSVSISGNNQPVSLTGINGISLEGGSLINSSVRVQSNSTITLNSDAYVNLVGGTQPGSEAMIQNTGLGANFFIFADSLLLQCQVASANASLQMASGSLYLTIAHSTLLTGFGGTANIQNLNGDLTFHSTFGNLHLLGQTCDANILINGNMFITLDRGDLSIIGGSNSFINNTGSTASIYTYGDILLDAGNGLNGISILGNTSGSTTIISENGGLSIFGNTNPSSAPSFLSAGLIAGTDMNVTVHNDIVLNGNVDPSSFIGSNTGNIFIQTGQSLLMSGLARIEGLSPSAAVTIVTDADFPTAPDSGTGHIFMSQNTFINAPQVLSIFTANREYNTLGGLLNGTAFAPGTLFVNTAREIWNTYYPSNLGSYPYTIFYKNTVPPPIPTAIPDSVLQRVGINETVQPDLFSQGFVFMQEEYRLSYLLDSTPSSFTCAEKNNLAFDASFLPYFEQEEGTTLAYESTSLLSLHTQAPFTFYRQKTSSLELPHSLKDQNKKEVYALYQEKDFCEVLHFLKSLESTSEKESLVLLVGEKLIEENDLMTAHALFQNYLTPCSKYKKEAILTLAKKYESLNNLKEAKSLIEKEPSLNYSVIGREMLASIALKEKDTAKALEIYTSIQSRSPIAKKYVSTASKALLNGY